MGAYLLKGGPLAKAILAEAKETCAMLTSDLGRPPALAVVLVGEDPASCAYVRRKEEACQRTGIRSRVFRIGALEPEERFLEVIDELNRDHATDGILVQLPLPAHIDAAKAVQAIAPEKDVDGFHPLNLGRLALGCPVFRACTPAGIMRLLQESGIEPCGMRAVVVGASIVVGKPLALELLAKGATVTICHRHTRDLAAHVREAELLVVAAGSPKLIAGAWVREGAVVVDVGINRLDSGAIVGDVDFDEAKTRASWITPVPGGVGPMTVAMLIVNTLLAAKRHLKAWQMD